MWLIDNIFKTSFNMANYHSYILHVIISFYLNIYFISLFMFAWMWEWTVCVHECSWESGKETGSHGAGVLGSCELLTWHLKPYLGLQEK